MDKCIFSIRLGSGFWLKYTEDKVLKILIPQWYEQCGYWTIKLWGWWRT